MGEFFHSWQRKLGCVTLVLACFFTMLWVRSFDVDQWGYGDYLILGASMSDCSTLHSQKGMLEWVPPQQSTTELRTTWRVAHWMIVFPLTIGSAWLILSRPKT